jgi:hypothetical protein
LEEQAEHLRVQALQHIMAAVQGVNDRSNGNRDEDDLRGAVAEAIPSFFEARLTGVATALREKIAKMLAAHQARSDALIASVRRTAAELFDVPFSAADPAEPFHLNQEPYWLKQKQQRALMPSSGSLLTRLLPAGRHRQARLRQHLDTEIADLVQNNVENLRWATLRALEDTFRRTAARMDKQIAAALAVTQDVITAALERRRSRAEAVETDLSGLQVRHRRLERCRVQLSDCVTELS